MYKHKSNIYYEDVTDYLAMYIGEEFQEVREFVFLETPEDFLELYHHLALQGLGQIEIVTEDYANSNGIGTPSREDDVINNKPETVDELLEECTPEEVIEACEFEYYQKDNKYYLTDGQGSTKELEEV